MKLASLLDSGLKEVGPRFTWLGLLPGLTLFALVAALLASGAPQTAPDPARLLAAAKDPGSGEALLAAAGLLAIGLIAHPLQLSLVQLLEGYWGSGPLARRLAAWATARHARRRSALEKALVHEGSAAPTAAQVHRMQASAAELRQRYPSADRLLPTALGNALRAAEDRPLLAYGLDGVVIWPRLFPLLPQTMRELLADARTQLDVVLRFAAVFVLAALACAGLLWRHPGWLPLALLPLALAALSYRAGVQAAIAYGQAVEVAFDLYRFSLYPALHLELPGNPEEERQLNRELSAFLRQGRPMSRGYAHPPPAKPG